VSAPTLDDWVERAGFAELREQFLCHAQQFVEPSEGPENLVRLLMISLRDHLDEHGPRCNECGDRYCRVLRVHS
jgi:hypothetical protein